MKSLHSDNTFIVILRYLSGLEYLLNQPKGRNTKAIGESISYWISASDLPGNAMIGAKARSRVEHSG
jgi:hypothetical protein